MEGILRFVDSFQNVFAEGGATLMDLITGILPMVLVLLTVFNAIAALVGEKRLEKLSRFLAKSKVLSYTVLPFIGWFFLCNPMVFSFGKFLPQRQRAGFIDAVATTNGPMLSLFPHINPAELFIWLGIAQGVSQLGLSTTGLAVRFLLSGFLLALIRGLITENVWVFLAKREGLDVNR